MATITPDPAASGLTTNGALTEPAISFRGYLSPRVPDNDEKGVYRLFTSLWFDEWLEIKSADLLYQIPGSTTITTTTGNPPQEVETTNIQMADGASLVWVRKRANINRCHVAEACEIAEQDQAASDDPTSGLPSTAKPQRPRY